MNKYLKFLSAGFIFFIIFSCSGTPPKIHQIFWKRIFTVNNGNIETEYLSVFVSVSDEDGVNDIESVYIIQDNAELFWKLDPDTWSEKKIGSELWIGSNAVKMQDGSDLPQGDYRVVIIDAGGERDSREFHLPEKSLSVDIPLLSIAENGVVTVVSPFDDNFLWLKNEKGMVVKVLKVIPGNISSDLILKDIHEKITVFSLYAFDASTNCGYLISKPNKSF